MQKSYLKKIALLFIISIVFCFNKANHSKPISKKEKIAFKVDSILKLMTLEEKVGQMNLYNGFWDVTGPTPKEGSAVLKYEHLKKGWVGSMLTVRGVDEVRKVQKIAVEESRLGIPLIFGFDVIHGYKTISPIPLAEAASWDLDAIENSARIAAIEASASGINWTFAPMVDITRDARWGRIMEGAGEDPYLGSKIATARIKGFQGNDLTAENTIAATAKHFAAYGFLESGKEYNSVEITSSTLHNNVFPPFKAAVDAGVKSVMSSFNEYEGVPATGNYQLLKNILKGKWNFSGFVVSDWASIKEMTNWGYSKDLEDASKKAAISGTDVDMESYAYVTHLVKLVNDGEVPVSIIDDAVRRILTLKFELGLFDDPYKYCNNEREKEMIGHQLHHESVLEMAKKSIVLLKNENNLLPLKKEGQKIALIGALANDKDSPLGSWRIAATNNSAVSVLEGMKSYKKNNLTYAKGADVAIGKTSFVQEIEINETDKSNFKEAIQVAKNADIVVMVLGEVGFQSGEARTRTNLQLPGVQQELLEVVYKVNKNIVLVLNNGRPLAITWADKHIPAIVEAWHLGSQAGNAIAQVLYGDYNPSGKLPVTFPRNVGQVPIYYNHKNTGRPENVNNDVFYSHFIDSESTPLYPFGFGLSYTTFEYGKLQLETISNSVTNPKIKISVTVSNTGKFDGKEIVQLYIRDIHASYSRPVKELKDFKLIPFKVGESKEVSFILDKSDLGFYNLEGNYIIEPGEFQVFVGTNSETNFYKNFTLF